MTKGELWPDPLLTSTCSPPWFLRTLQTPPFHHHLVLVPLPLYLAPLIPSSANFWSLSHPVQSLSLPYNVLTSFLHTHFLLSQSLPELFSHHTIFWNSPHSWQFCLFWGRSRKEEKRDLVMSSALNFKKLMRFLGYWGLKKLHERWIGLTAGETGKGRVM